MTRSGPTQQHRSVLLCASHNPTQGLCSMGVPVTHWRVSEASPADRPVAHVNCCLVFRGVSARVDPFPQSETTLGRPCAIINPAPPTSFAGVCGAICAEPPEAEPPGLCGHDAASVGVATCCPKGRQKLPAPSGVRGFPRLHILSPRGVTRRVPVNRWV